MNEPTWTEIWLHDCTPEVLVVKLTRYCAETGEIAYSGEPEKCNCTVHRAMRTEDAERDAVNATEAMKAANRAAIRSEEASLDAVKSAKTWKRELDAAHDEIIRLTTLLRK